MEEKMSEIIQLATPVLRDVSEFASVILDASAAHVNFTPGTVPADTAAVLPGALKRVNAAADGAAAATDDETDTLSTFRLTGLARAVYTGSGTGDSLTGSSENDTLDGGAGNALANRLTGNPSGQNDPLLLSKMGIRLRSYASTDRLPAG